MTNWRLNDACKELEPQRADRAELVKSNQRKINDWIKPRMVAPSVFIGTLLIATMVFQFMYFDTFGFVFAAIGFSSLAAWILQMSWYALHSWAMIRLEIAEKDLPYEWHLCAEPKLNLWLSGFFLMMGGALWVLPIAIQVIPIK